MDATTSQIVKEWVEKYDAAVESENFEEMSKIIDMCCESPNIPFKKEICRQLGI